MLYFTAIVHKDEGSAYGITFPDLPGAFAASDDWEGIPKAASEALDLWFEDMPNVEPASLDEIRKSDEAQTAVKEGAVLMPVPYIHADTATERLNITMERALVRSIDQFAKMRGMTRSSFLASAARRELTGT